MRYKDLKNERDEAIRARVEAERLSMKSEFERVTAEFEREKDRLHALAVSMGAGGYQRGFSDGLAEMAALVRKVVTIHATPLEEAITQPAPPPSPNTTNVIPLNTARITREEFERRWGKECEEWNQVKEELIAKMRGEVVPA